MTTDKWAFINRDGKQVLKLQCPQCKEWGDLEDHSVDECGQVVPSVDCTECDFHDLVILTGFPNNPYQGKTYGKNCNHHHELTEEQEIVDFGTGEFVADRKRVALLKALNECGLITRTHCYGHETGISFISVLINEHVNIEIREVTEPNSNRDFCKNQRELLINWKRID